MGAKVQGTGSNANPYDTRPITALGLKALTPADDGKSIKFGESMTGKVRAGRDGAISVHVTWRYRIGGKVREVRIGTWRDKDGMTLKALRDERNRLATDLRSGTDPIERKAAEKLKAEVDQAENARNLRLRIEATQATELAQSRRITVRQAFDRWRATDLQPSIRADGTRSGRKDGGQFVYDQFTRHVFPGIGGMALEDVRKSDLLVLIDAQKAKGQIRTAQMLLGDLRQMLGFGLDRDLIQSDPLATVKKARIVGKQVERERVLSDEELRLMVQAVADARMHIRNATAIWLALATGVRVGELMGAVWAEGLPETGHAYQSCLDALQALCDSKAVTAAQRCLAKAVANGEDRKIDSAKQQLATYEAFGDPDRVKVGVIDRTARTWYLPDTKNQRDHTIHLSDFALVQIEVLRQHREVQTKSTGRELSPWVFPATNNTMPVCVKSFGKQLGDRQRKPEERMSRRTKATTSLVMPGGRWTAHDLRRTVGTIMSKLGISGDTIDECLNHKIESRVRRVYVQDRREADQIRAFDALGARLTAIVSGETESSNVMPIKPA